MSISELIGLYEAGIISLAEVRHAVDELLQASFGISLDAPAE